VSQPRLSVERLFDDPPLFRPLPTGLRFAPDGSFIAFLRVAGDDRERLDLWRCDPRTLELRCWLNAQELTASQGELSQAEKAERERRRQFSTGITSFTLSPDGRWALLCADGAGHLLSVTDGALTQVTPQHTRQTDLRFSATGSQLSYVRDGNLLRYDVESGREHALSTDGGGSVQYGLADFIAAEEMHRFDGHWWSPDDAWIAYTRVDDSCVEVSRRFEIGADSFDTIEQRYPYAGEVNAQVELLVQRPDTGTTTTLKYADHADDYLARVDWIGGRLAVQSQSRNQQTLTLKFFDPETGHCEQVLTERSDTWIDLHDNFIPIDAERFVWTSERSGSAQLYFYANGECRALTEGAGRVTEVLHADPRQAFYLGWRATPTEQHLFRVTYAADGSATKVQQLTREPGWHEAVLAADASVFIDRWTSLTNPGQIDVTKVAGLSECLARETIDADHPYFPFLPLHASSELGTLTAADGQTLHYRLTTPEDLSLQHPVVVSVYGGPGVQRVKNEWPPAVLQLFSQRGYGVLELDNRGSNNRERSFQDPIHGQLGAVEVDDQVTGAEFLRTLAWVDPNRIGVFGHSYGGYMALMCMSKAASVFRAGVAVAPVSDWRLYDTHYTERYLGMPLENPDGYAASAVFPYLDQIDGRLLIIHGMADDNVLFTHSTKLFAALQQSNKRFEMMTYPGSKHALQEREVSVHRFNLILDFFDRGLHSPA
jgi:dipeptidyl-peptidase-4